jgi:hypothetical protein
MVGDLMDALRAASDGRKPVWAAIQCAPAGGTDLEHLGQQASGRAPTAAEVEALAYHALVHGAKGLVFYAYRKPGFVLPSGNQMLWYALGDLNRQLQELEPVLLDGSWIQLADLAGGAVELARWETDGGNWFIAVNLTSEEQAVSLPLAEGCMPVAYPLEGGREVMTGSVGLLPETFAPYQVRVYRVG